MLTRENSHRDRPLFRALLIPRDAHLAPTACSRQFAVSLFTSAFFLGTLALAATGPAAFAQLPVGGFLGEDPTEEQVEEQIEDQLEEEVEETVEDEVVDVIEDNVEESVEEQVAQSVEQATQQNIQENIEETIEETIEQTVDASVENNIDTTVAQAVEESVEDSITDAIEVAALASAEDFVEDDVMDSINDGVTDLIESEVESNVSDSIEASVDDSVQDTVEAAVEANLTQNVESDVQETVAQAVEDAVAESVESSVTENVEAGVTDAVEDSVSDVVAASVENTVEAAVENQVLDATAQEVESAIESGVEDTVASSVEQTIAAQVEASVEGGLEANVEDQVEEAVEDNVEEEVASAIETSVEDAVASAVEDSVADAVEESVASSVEESISETVDAAVSDVVEDSVSDAVEESVAEAVEETVSESVASSVEDAVEATVEQAAEVAVEAGVEAAVEDRIADAIADRLDNEIDEIVDAVEAELEIDESRIIKEQWLVMADPEVFDELTIKGYLFDLVTDLPGLGLRLAEVAAPSTFDITEVRNGVLDVVGKNRAEVDLNHIYTAGIPQPTDSGAGVLPNEAIEVPNDLAAMELRVGMIDSEVDTSHPALARSSIQTRSFAREGSARPDFHGTAIASIIAANSDEYQGLAPSAHLYAASVFELDKKQGEIASTVSLIRAIDWLISSEVDVVNLSLAGPPNRLLERALDRAAKKDVIVMAAAGNGGPVAQPMYPAAYETVVAVTAVDKAQRVFRLANRGDYLAISAPGVDLRHAEAGGGYAASSGTSFAVPFAVTAAARLSQLGPKSEIVPSLLQSAEDIGPPGRDSIYGYGLLNLSSL